MTDQFSRSRLIYGDAGVESLQNARVAVFGLGGVGGQVCEALVRTGLGSIDIIDHDVVDLTNLNRQIIATQNTVGMRKIDAMEKRLASINPQCKIQKHDCFFLPETAPQFDFSCYDYIVDAIDTVTAKLELIMCAKKQGCPLLAQWVQEIKPILPPYASPTFLKPQFVVSLASCAKNCENEALSTLKSAIQPNLQ